jgi:hypothetical protein
MSPQAAPRLISDLNVKQLSAVIVGLTGRSNIPVAAVLEQRRHGVLDARRSLSSGGA